MPLLDDYEYLKTYALALSHDSNKVSELVQDTLIKCWQMHPKCDSLPPKQAMAYTKKILHNIFIDSIRKKNRDGLTFELHDLTGAALPTPFDITDAKKVAKEAAKKIEAILKYIPTKIRKQQSYDAWLMRKWLGYTYKKIAGILGISIDSVAQSIRTVDNLIKARFFDLTKKDNFFDKEPGEIAGLKKQNLEKRLKSAETSKEFYDNKRKKANKYG